MADYLKDNMTEVDFLTWKVSSLKKFLRERGIILSGKKADFAQKAYFAFKLNLEVQKNKENEENDVIHRKTEKLTIECGIKLPFPSDLKGGWQKGSQNFPDVMEENIQAYMQNFSNAKKQGQSLVTSNHIFEVMFHHISTNVKYCFIRCRCVPEEKTDSDPYSLWVCVHKKNGAVLTAECSCFAG